MYPDYEVKKPRSFRALLEIMEKDHGDEIAFSSPEGEWTYLHLASLVKRYARGIKALPQKKVRLDLARADLFAALYLATVSVGKVAVLGEAHLPLTSDAVLINGENHLSFLSPQPIECFPDFSEDDPCTVLHSSGTSSAPKGILLSSRNLLSDTVGGLEKYAMRKGDRFINLIPCYHAFGLVCDLLGPLLVGATVFVLEDKKLFFSQMSHLCPTVLNAPPAIARALLKLIRMTGDASAVTGGELRKILCGGAGLEASVSRKLREYGIFAYGCYGLSEASPCVAVNRDEWYKDGSAGVPLNCNTVTTSEDGEILLQGSNVMLGYDSDPEATSRVLRDGVLHTGDLGYLDEDGFLFITGRKSNLIVFEDGTKCSPEVYEEAILSHTPAEEALVFRGKEAHKATLRAKIYLPDPTLDEKVREYITKNLSSHHFEEILFVRAPLPKSATGKIIRGEQET